MTEPVPFTFPDSGQPIRVVMIEGEPWFVIADVCTILTISNSRDATTRLKLAGVGSTDIRSGGQIREVKVMNEANLYRLVLRSDKPEAEPFITWVTEEVIPSIRKTGAYLAPTMTKAEMYRAMAEIEEALERSQAKTKELEPAAEQHYKYLQPTHLLLGDVARMMGLKQTELRNILVKHAALERVPRLCGYGDNLMPTVTYEDWFALEQATVTRGHQCTAIHYTTRFRSAYLDELKEWLDGDDEE